MVKPDKDVTKKAGEDTKNIEPQERIQTKICKKYPPPHERPLTDFANNAANPDGLERACKDCMAKYRQELKQKKEEEKRRTLEKGTKKKVPSPGSETTILLEARLIQNIRKALKKEFAQEVIKWIEEEFLQDTQPL